MATKIYKWDTDELKQTISRLYGYQYLQQNEIYLDSFWKKVFAAWLNRDEALSLTKSLVPDSNKHFPSIDYLNALDYHFECFGDKNKLDELEYNKQHIETHILSFAVSLYSLSDVIGQIIISSFNVRDSIKPDEIYLGTACDFIPKECCCKTLRRRINKLFKLNSYQYLKRFVNVQKHVIHIDVPFSFLAEVPDNKISHGMQIKSFKYDGTLIDAKWAITFVKDDFAEVFNTYLEIGCEINTLLRSRLGCEGFLI